MDTKFYIGMYFYNQNYRLARNFYFTIFFIILIYFIVVIKWVVNVFIKELPFLLDGILRREGNPCDIASVVMGILSTVYQKGHLTEKQHQLGRSKDNLEKTVKFEWEISSDNLGLVSE